MRRARSRAEIKKQRTMAMAIAMAMARMDGRTMDGWITVLCEIGSNQTNGGIAGWLR
jgi:hypothetical protein